MRAVARRAQHAVEPAGVTDPSYNKRGISEAGYRVEWLRGVRVCFIASTLGGGGAEQQLYHMLRVLRGGGGCARVLTLGSGEFWEPHIRELGCEVCPVGNSRSRLRRLWAMAREVRRFRPHILQAQHFHANLYASLLARCLGFREIGAIRNNVVSECADVGGLAGQICLRGPRLLAANSKAALRHLERDRRLRSRLFFLPNAVDLARFRLRPGPPSKSFTILGVGRLVPQKRFDIFLEVLARVNARHAVRGLIAGEGPLRGELEKQAARLCLGPGRLEFLGRVKDVAALHRAASLLLLTSDYEGTPNAILEAMTSGLPFVATPAGDLPELAGEGTRGRLAKCGDVAGLQYHVEELIRDRSLGERLARQARAYVETHHSAEVLRTHLQALYEAALSA